jgi:Spy/CpxP family protein refolding chaperone
MKTKILATLLLAAPLLATPFLALAQPPAGDDHACMAKMSHHAQNPGGHEPIPPFLHGVKLSDAQQDKVFELMLKQAPLMHEKGKIARQSMNELHQGAFTERYDEERARTLARAAANAESEIALLRTQTDQKIFALLTPEQRKEVAANIAGRPGLPL